MNISELETAIQEFKSITTNMSTPIVIEPPVSIQAGNFPDKCHELPEEGNGKGIYLFTSNLTEEVLYIGKSALGDSSISARFYDHIGCGFHWNRNGSEAAFPSPKIINKAGIPEEVKKIIVTANFSISVLSVSPPEAISLLESFLIFWAYDHKGKPKLNIDF